MKFFFLLFTVSFAACFYFGKDQYHDILQHPSVQWSSRDCLTIVLSAMESNIFDRASNIRVMATPYYPSVITAINRINQSRKHLTEDQYIEDMDIHLQTEAGLYMDWQNQRLVDARGNYVQDKLQIDSLMFLITLRNKNWPCNIPQATVRTPNGSYVMAPIASLADWPCYIPDITDLEQKIFLVNDKRTYIIPRFVWGKKRNQLTMDETLLVMFQLRRGDYHFFTGSDNMYLVIKGFQNDIQLKFPLSMMR